MVKNKRLLYRAFCNLTYLKEPYVRQILAYKGLTIKQQFYFRARLLIACVLWLSLRFVIEAWFQRQAGCLARKHNEEHEPQKKPLWVTLKHLSAAL